MKCISILFLCHFAFHLQATNYYVSNDGSNSNNGLSLVDAFLTIQYPIDQMTIHPGDTIFVADGNYKGFNNWDWSGAANSPIVFMALGENTLIDQSLGFRDDGINIENVNYIVIDGFRVDSMPGSGNGIRVVNSDFCIVRNCTAIGNAERGIFTGFTDDIIIEYNTCIGSLDEHGIYVSNSSDRAIIRYNTCHDNNNIGIHCNADQFSGGDGISEDFEIYGNIIYSNNRAAGINLDGIVNAKVYNNLIYNNHSANGIVCFQIDGAVPSTGAQIYNNTIIVPTDGRWGICLKDGSHVGAKVYNNIILNMHASRGSICTEGITNMASDYNIVLNRMNATDDDPSNNLSLANWQLQTGQDQHSMAINASDFNQLFENMNQDNYQLADSSIAIDSGTDIVDSCIINDLRTYFRPAKTGFDIGAYEKYSCQFQTLEIGPVIDQMIYSNADSIKLTGSVTSNSLILMAQNSIELIPEMQVINQIFEAIIQDCP